MNTSYAPCTPSSKQSCEAGINSATLYTRENLRLKKCVNCPRGQCDLASKWQSLDLEPSPLSCKATVLSTYAESLLSPSDNESVHPMKKVGTQGDTEADSFQKKVTSQSFKLPIKKIPVLRSLLLCKEVDFHGDLCLVEGKVILSKPLVTSEAYANSLQNLFNKNLVSHPFLEPFGLEVSR